MGIDLDPLIAHFSVQRRFIEPLHAQSTDESGAAVANRIQPPQIIFGDPSHRADRVGQQRASKG